MDRAKLIKRVKNLEKIKGIVEIAKFDTLQKLAHAQKIKDHHYESATIAKKIILFSKEKFYISNKLLQKKNNLIDRTLWIYITIPSKLIKVSYDKFNRMLNANFNKELDEIIAVGSPAIEWSKNNKFKIYKEFENLNDSGSLVANLINYVVFSKEFSSIKIVANTPFIKEEPFQLFPIENENFDKKEFAKVKFYHSLSSNIANISNTYVENTIEGIFQETYRLFYKEKLIKHEGSITNIDDRMFNLKKELNKIERKKDTEEMIQITQLATKRE